MSLKSNLVVAFAMSAWTFLATAQPANPLPAIEARVERLQSRLDGTESVRAIKRVQYAYGHYVELGLWNDFADLFTDGAVTNYQQGVRGKAEVRKLFFEQVGQGKLGLAEGRIYPHILFQPVITLSADGRSAKGRWRILAMLGGYGGSATWYSGVYENEYVLEGGAWKISVLHSEPKATASYTAAGWKDSGIRVPFHYTDASVTKPVPDGGTPKTASGTLASRIQELARRAARLNDQDAVTNVLNTYGDAVNRKLWNQAADLFAPKGTLELGLQGVYVGKARIRQALDHFGGGAVNDHVYLQTLVTVAGDGRTAKARGVELIFSSGSGGSSGTGASGGELSEGTFENTFVKQGGTWKIQSVHFFPRMIVDAEAGWAKSAKPAPGPSKQFAPDRPPTAAYEIYPKFAVAPFHFDNPVTGKPPQYPQGVAELPRPAPAAAPAMRSSANNLENRVKEVERSMTAAETYDVAENLLNAFGYSQDDTPATNGSIFVDQVLQPIIDIAPDGKSAKVRARRLDLSGTSAGPGYWTAGTLEGEIIFEQGSWKFQTPRSTTVWSAPYPGGWVRVR
jgi:hypothetical protein